MSTQLHVPARERHALVHEPRPLRDEVRRETAARIDDPVARHARIVAVVHREAREARSAWIARDHRDEPIRGHAAARDPTDDVVDALVALVPHTAD